jgi:hypothetical protein
MTRSGQYMRTPSTMSLDISAPLTRGQIVVIIGILPL